MNGEIIKDWEPYYSEVFSKQTLKLQHGLAESGLFSEDVLAGLIDRYPSSHYNLATMGADPSRPVWREGDINGVSGQSVIEAIRNGRMWINLRRVKEVDERYRMLLESIFAEFEARVPGLKTFKQDLGILISSPKAQVFYHADIPGQSLWQLSGRKRIYLYPNEEPFLRRTALEGMILGETEEDIHYEPWFEDYAETYDLEPGQMLHWALNRPHRVVNEDCLNISVTTEHYTDEIRKSYAVNYANGVLRRRFGMRSLSSSTTGAAVYAKAALALSWKKLNLNRSRHFVHKTDFMPDPQAPLGLVDISETVKA